MVIHRFKMYDLRCKQFQLLLSFIFCLSSFVSFAQFYNLPQEYFFGISTQKNLAVRDSSIHSSIQPYIAFFSKAYEPVLDTTISKNNIVNSLFHKHVLRVEPKDEKFQLHLDPLLNLEFGRDLKSTTPQQNLYTNTRGFIANGNVGSKVYFETLFAENQSIFPDYIANNTKATSVVPGQGRWKNYKTSGFDYAFSSGFVSFQAFKNVNIQVGHGKQKIGNGYRSLLLSDNAFNYPYARITQQWFKGRLQYTNIYAVLMNLTSASAIINPNTERLFQKKAASFQYLSINPAKWLNIGFFQGLIWQAGDSRNQQHLKWEYFNPIIYSNLPEYGLNNRNNILIGADLKVKITNKLNVYGQVMLDNVKDMNYAWDSYGWQAGINYFDAFGIKNLFLQVECDEMNTAPFVSTPLVQQPPETYTHYGQNLAYTLPYGGSEWIFISSYKWKRLFVNAKYNWQEPEVSSPFIPLSHNNIINAKIGYVINPAYNLNIALGVNYRKQNFQSSLIKDQETNYIYISFRTNLYNIYYDF